MKYPQHHVTDHALSHEIWGAGRNIELTENGEPG
jgi:hypothetical protein